MAGSFCRRLFQQPVRAQARQATTSCHLRGSSPALLGAGYAGIGVIRRRGKARLIAFRFAWTIPFGLARGLSENFTQQAGAETSAAITI